MTGNLLKTTHTGRERPLNLHFTPNRQTEYGVMLLKGTDLLHLSWVLANQNELLNYPWIHFYCGFEKHNSVNES